MLFFLYVWLCTVPLGPVGGAFFYERDIQDRLVELGLTTRERIELRRTVAVASGLIALLVVLFTCVCMVNGARRYLDIVWQSYVLYALMEIFDCVVIDTWWVALSGWWDIPGTEDLRASYTNWRAKMRVKAPRALMGGVPLAFVLAGLFWVIALTL